MPHASFKVNVVVQALPEQVFEYVSDLTRHGEWSADHVTITALSNASIGVGSRYRSVVISHGGRFTADLSVSEYDPPSHFGFAGEDATGKFSHIFTFQPNQTGTLVTREIQLNVTVLQWLIFFVLLYPVRISAARRALQLLKERIEGKPNAL